MAEKTKIVSGKGPEGFMKKGAGDKKKMGGMKKMGGKKK